MGTLPLLTVLMLQTAQADVSSCSASVSPTSVNANTTATLVFSVNNTSSVSVVWVKFTAPSEDFEILSGSSSGWSTTLESPTVIIFKNGTLAAGSSTNFTVNIQAGVHGRPAATWPVTASDSSTGSPATTCSGDTAVAIIGPDNTAPVISNITVSNITTSSVRITWTTDEAANSVVEYGLTNSYGSTQSDSSLVTSHTIDLTGLSANTTYHYRVKSTDAANNTAQSSDNTFTTAQASSSTDTSTPTPAKSSSGSAATPTPTPTAAQKKPKKTTPASTPIPTPEITFVDNTSPVVKITTDVSKPVGEIPLIGGEATDDGGVQRVDYSTDGGKNWLPALLDGEPNRRGVAFTFTPQLTADDNYDIRARAFDFAGNVGYSPAAILVLDRLPPRAGGALLTVGPQVLRPASDGVIYASQGIDTKVTLSAVGGATTIDIIAPLPDSDRIPHVFSLVKSVESGLWSGIMHFTEAGPYTLTVQARDGASNLTSRELATLLVVPGGQVRGSSGPLADATVELFYFEPTLEQFVRWHGEAFYQSNPQLTDASGHYHFLIPPGKYYARLSASGHATATTSIFSVDGSRPLIADVTLPPRAAWQLGALRLSLPQLRAASVTPTILPPTQTADAISQQLIGTSLSPIEPLGHPALITFMTEWSPDTPQQLSALSSLDQSALGTAGVVMGDSNQARLASLRKRGAYLLPMVADSTGELFEQYHVSYVPTHVFVSPAGEIKRIIAGVLNAAELRHNIDQ